MNRRICALLCGVLSFSLLTGCEDRPEEAQMDTTVSVRTTAAQTGDLSKNGIYIGTISAEGTAEVVTMVSGTVEKVSVEVGSVVTPQTLLCRINDESARLSLQSAQAAYNSTLANYGGSDLPLLQEQLQQAENQYNSTLALFELGSATQTEVDQAKQSLNSAQVNLDAARASLSSAQVSVESAEYQLSQYRITSPISGVVEAVYVSENSHTNAGTTAFVISNGNNKTVTFYVTDQVRQTLEAGQEVKVSHSGRVYSGVVTEIGGVVDTTTGQFKVKAVIEDAWDLPDGLSVELITTAYQAENAVLVPSDALFFENGNAYVYVVEDGAARRTEVTVGIYATDISAVTEGLEPETEVITTWSSSLRDGVPIRVSNLEADMFAEGSEGGESGEQDSSAEGR